MRAALLLVAACWRQEATTTPQPATEPDSRTVYRREPVRSDPTAPPVGPIFGGGRPPPSPPISPTTARTHFVGALTCGPTPNATANGIALTAIDRTGRNIDLCARMDTALSKVPNLANYQNRRYDLALELSNVDVHGGDVGCKLRFEIVAPAARTGFVMTGAKIQGAPAIVPFSIDDCINAAIEDTFVRKIFP